MGSQKRDVLCDRTSALTNADLQAGEFDFGAAAGSAHEQDGHMVWGVSERPRFNSGAIRNDAIRHKVAGDLGPVPQDYPFDRFCAGVDIYSLRHRSEEHTSELQSLMRISYAVFCLKKKTRTQRH